MEDIQPKTERFAVKVINFCREISKDPLMRSMASQLIRSATSIGANYTEALSAVSRKDFRNKIYICRKEANETKYWIKLLRECLDRDADGLFEECDELCKIFNAATYTLDKKPKLKEFNT